MLQVRCSVTSVQERCSSTVRNTLASDTPSASQPALPAQARAKAADEMAHLDSARSERCVPHRRRASRDSIIGWRTTAPLADPEERNMRQPPGRTIDIDLRALRRRARARDGTGSLLTVVLKPSPPVVVVPLHQAWHENVNASISTVDFTPTAPTVQQCNSLVQRSTVWAACTMQPLPTAAFSDQS